MRPTWTTFLLLCACAREAAPPTATNPTPPARQEEGPKKVTLSSEVRKEVIIRTEAAHSEVISPWLDLPGEIAADPDLSARVVARSPGRIQQVRFREGDQVKAGAVLATLESPELARARAAHISAHARAEAARHLAQRTAELVKDGLAPVQQQRVTEAEAVGAEAEEKAARLLLTAYGADQADTGDGAQLLVRTPISGTVVARDAIVGQAVLADHVLGTVVNLERVYFHARVYEKDVAQIQPGVTAVVDLNAFPGTEFPGKVDVLGRQIDPVTRTLVARISLVNGQGLLRLGLAGTAHVTDPAAPKEALITVPRSAITRLGTADVVFVAAADGRFEVRNVVLGRSAGDRVAIQQGVLAGEPTVVEGTFTLKSVALKSTFAEGQ